VYSSNSMTCNICNKNMVELSPTVVVEDKERMFYFIYCPHCHGIRDSNGNPVPMFKKCDSNEEDMFRWMLGGGSNMGSGL
jgi:hypothetical protein